MPLVSLAYNGSNEVVATITGAVVGHTYGMRCEDPDSSGTNDVAATSILQLTISDIGGGSAGQPFDCWLMDETTTEAVAVTNFAFGQTNQYFFGATWVYDGANTVNVTFDSDLGVNYSVYIFDDDDVYNSATIVGTGNPITIPATAGADFDGKFVGVLYHNDSPFESYSSRLFTQGSPGPGAPGNPSVQGGVIVTLAGADVTAFCVAGQWTRRLSRPSTAQIRCNMEVVNAPVGSLLKIEALIGTTYEIVHHGRVLDCETDTETDGGYTVYNSTDPMEMWQWRPVRDDDGDFTKPGIIDTYVTGPQIVEAMLMNTEGDTTAQGNPALTPPTFTEGPTFLDFGTFAGGGVDLTGAPTDWPMTIAELASLLISTGEVDVVITPTDPGGGIMGTIDVYNGDYGTDLSGSIVFSYGMGDYNVRRLRWNQDMTSMCNKLWYFGGPRIQTAADPAGDQHWCFNVQGDDPNLAYPPGGALSPPASSTDNQLGVLRVNSRADYGVRMDIQIFDAYDECAGVGAVGRDLFRRRWQQESWLRAQPRELIHITPTRETEIGTFDVGDLVGVEAVAAVRGGFSGVQRVYEYTVSWDADGTLELSELQTSADNEGL